MLHPTRESQSRTAGDLTIQFNHWRYNIIGYTSQYRVVQNKAQQNIHFLSTIATNPFCTRQHVV